MSDTVTVTGHGAASGTPDIVVLRVGAESGDESPAGAFAAASRSIAAMIAALRGAGLTDADLQTSGATVNEWHEPGIAGRYHGSQQLTVVLRDLDSVGSLVSRVIEAGGASARLQGLSFSIADPAALSRAAREAAWHDAVDRARQFAELAGRRLGAVRRIAEGAPQLHVPHRRARTPAAVPMGFAMPVEAGENEIAATVEVEWALTD